MATREKGRPRQELLIAVGLSGGAACTLSFGCRSHTFVVGQVCLSSGRLMKRTFILTARADGPRSRIKNKNLIDFCNSSHYGARIRVG